MRRVEEVSAARTLPLRARVLRPGMAPAEELFGGPMPANARHFACFEGEEIVGVGYIVPAPPPFGVPGQAWQLRGMAVEPHLQGQGIGALIVRRVEEEARRENVEVLWFNARRVAVGFYQKLGFATRGEEFDIAGVGPHTVMWRRIDLEVR